ncbi:MAG TPA: hypothetical protein VK081_03450 [Planctomycetota bacterium]|nr:hypothetical protein [Planctomycetota bacterium]
MDAVPTESRPQTPANERGAILLDLMMACGVALIVGGALVTTSVRQSAHRAVNHETTLANNAIADVFARLRGLPFADLPSLHGTGFDVPNHLGGPGGLTAQPGDPDGLPGEIQVAVYASGGSTVLYRVTVTVAWRGAAGNRRERVIGLIGERRS